MQRAGLLSEHSGQEEGCGEGGDSVWWHPGVQGEGAVCSKDRKTATHEKPNNNMGYLRSK